MLRKAAKITTVLVAIMFLLSGSLGLFADLGTSVYRRKLELKPTPLLVVLLSFDADADGENDFLTNPNMLTTMKLPDGSLNPVYGEQWAYTKASDWKDRFFGDTGYTLKNYYKEMSGDRFYFKPADETQGTANDGVIDLVLPQRHPQAVQTITGKNTGGAFLVLAEALKACDQYVDFKAYDTNNDGGLDSNEFNVVFIHAGYDKSAGTVVGIPEIKFNVSANSGRLPVGSNAEGVPGAQAPNLDGVYVCADGWGAYTLFGEYRKYSQVLNPDGVTYSWYNGYYPIGTAAHELGHAIGFTDVYDYDSKVANWPQPTMFSLQGNGNYGCIIPDGLEFGTAGYTPGYPITGEVPTHVDPWQKINVGMMSDTTVVDGTYNVGSILSGKYNILRVNTPDPREYFLIENRQPEGFDKGMYYNDNYTIDGVTKNVKLNYKTGGIIVWHIDEDIIDQYFGIKRINGSGTYTPSGAAGTTRHDPGIVALFKNSLDSTTGLFRATDAETGKALKSGYPIDPFYYKKDGANGVFNSNSFVSAATRTRSLNSFPAGVSTDYNLKIEVLSEPGQVMKVKITGATEYAPRVTTDAAASITAYTASLSGAVVSDSGQTVTERGFVYSTASNPTLTNGTKAIAGSGVGNFNTSINGLIENTTYYARAYAINKAGVSYGEEVHFITNKIPVLYDVTFTNPTSISFKCSEKSTVYMVPKNTGFSTREQLGAVSIKSIICTPDITTSLSTNEVLGSYMIYAVDETGDLSLPYTFVITSPLNVGNPGAVTPGMYASSAVSSVAASSTAVSIPPAALSSSSSSTETSSSEEIPDSDVPLNPDTGTASSNAATALVTFIAFGAFAGMRFGKHHE